MIIILFHLQMMYILYFTYSTVCSPARSSVSHCVNHSVFQCLSQYTILLYNGFNINNHYVHYYKNVFAHKCYHYAYDSNVTSTFTFLASMFRVHDCACVIKFLLRKWRPIRDQTVFFHSICRYHLDTCRPQFYYKCDWNGARIIVIFQQTKK